MASIKNKSLFLGILIFCISILLFAYFVEYVLKHPPCNLCLIARIPYLATIILVIIVLFLRQYEKMILISIGLFFVFGTIISFYHLGIEQGFINESLMCNLGSGGETTSAQDLLKQLETKSVSCKDVTFKIFGLSLASFNTIVSFVISTIILRTAINYEKI
ncbi:MAG: disulfide bond formation protein B [Proteobacteria bacterium]|jgi:disulfide bond formation protein DsbB|nr:disulfide bond formation protein B [Pseudomonadota bacterium]